MRKSIEDNISFVTVVLIMLTLKGYYSAEGTNNIIYFLKPLSEVIAVLSGVKAEFINNEGFLFKDLNIMIDKSCSGFNLFIISYGVFALLFLRFYKKIHQKVIVIFSMLLLAYFTTLITNSSRIFCLLILEGRITNLLHFKDNIIHESIGIIINLSYLILFYIGFEKIIKLKTQKTL